MTASESEVWFQVFHSFVVQIVEIILKMRDMEKEPLAS